MLSNTTPTTNPTSDDREVRRQQILTALRSDADAILERMADHLVDLPEDKSFGQIEYDLRDLAHELAARAHQTGLDAGKKGATKVPAWSARAASTTPASSSTAANPG